MESFTEHAEKQQVSRFFITENNPSEESIERYKELNCKWIAISKEHEDDEEKTPHIHIAIVFNGKRRCPAVKKLFPRADVKIMRGTPQDCVTYMTKENPLLFEKGERPTIEKGSKNASAANKKKWEDAYQAAKEGRFDDIPRDMYVRYDRAFHRIYDENIKDEKTDDYDDNDLKDHNLWLWGPTGTGKSYWARKIAAMLDPDGEPYLKDNNNWWNGYKCHWVTLMEEVTPDLFKYITGNFKKWTDKWVTSAAVKCSHLNSMRPHYFIVTSNFSIDECFPLIQDSGPVHRRFTEIYLDKKYLEVKWPKNPQIKQKMRSDPPVAVGNINHCDGSDTSGLEPETKRQKVDDDVNETGLIDPPAILENTPEDFNSEEC